MEVRGGGAFISVDISRESTSSFRNAVSFSTHRCCTWQRCGSEAALLHCVRRYQALLVVSETAMGLGSDLMAPLLFGFLAAALFATAYVASNGFSEITCTLAVPVCYFMELIIFAEGDNLVTALHAVRRPVLPL